MYKTGITPCDELLEIHIQGNIIPQTWFKTIVKKDLKNPKPHLLAINILSDIVYWYRPSEIRDETTGTLLGYKKKFKDDLLQRSYDDFVNIYGYSAETIKEAIIFLERLGVIEREFRNKKICGIVCNNIMYINLNIAKLKELTYPSVEILTEDVKEISYAKEEISTQGGSKIPHTNTENTSNITTDITPSIPSDSTDGLSEMTLRELVYSEINKNNSIPFEYQMNTEKMEIAIKTLTDWYYLTPERMGQFNYDNLRMLIDCLTEMTNEVSPKIYHGSHVANGYKIIQKINEILSNDGSLNHWVNETLDDFHNATKNRNIQNIRNYLKSVIWTSLGTYRVKFNINFEKEMEHLVYS